MFKKHFITACELSSFLLPDDPPVPSNYELLKLLDVGLRSVYSDLSPYANTGGNAGLTSGKQDSVGYLHERLWVSILFLFSVKACFFSL